MNRKSIAVCIAGAGMLLAIVALWWRVHELGRSVDALTHQFETKPQIISAIAEEPVPTDRGDRPNYFKLIEVTAGDDGTSEIGVPWSVERAMMGDAAGRSQPRR